MIFDLIMAGCVWFTLLFCYLTLRSQTRRQKGLLLGVTLAADAMELPEVQQILARFQKELRLWCLAGAAGCLPMFAVHATWVKLTIWMVWFYAAMLLPYLPYLRAYLALRQVKRRLGGGPVCPTRVTDTAASETALPKPIGLWSLVLPLAVSLVPVFWPGQLTALRLVCLLDAATVVLLWVCGRWMFRRRADMVTNDSARNQTLVRVRRLYWDRFWRLNLWGLAGMNFCIGMFPTSAAAVGGCLLLTAVLLGGCLWMELSVRRIQEKLTAGAEVIADEDDAWLLGMFYYNPADPRMMVAKRLGVGTSMNLATRGGQILLLASGVLLVGCLFVGPWMGIMETLPTRLEIRGQTLTSLHGNGVKYEIPLENITDAQLLDTLPPSYRVVGTGMDTYLEGDFSVQGQGAAKFCLDPTDPLFLRVEADGRVYWFTAETPELTRNMGQWLAQQAE